MEAITDERAGGFAGQIHFVINYRALEDYDYENFLVKLVRENRSITKRTYNLRQLHDAIYHEATYKCLPRTAARPPLFIILRDGDLSIDLTGFFANMLGTKIHSPRANEASEFHRKCDEVRCVFFFQLR